MTSDAPWSDSSRSQSLRWADFHHRQGNDGSHQNIQQAVSWFSTCSESHPGCRPKHTKFLPSRLLDISSAHDKRYDVPSIRLVETKKFRRTAVVDYACLSHCWGGVEPPCITTQGTIHENKCNIRWSTIPQTFRDVIQVVKKLGLQYL